MKRICPKIFVLTVFSLLVGCNTFQARIFYERPKVYPGVQYDAKLFEFMFTKKESPFSKANPIFGFFHTLICLPVDTVALPYDIYQVSYDPTYPANQEMSKWRKFKRTYKGVRVTFKMPLGKDVGKKIYSDENPPRPIIDYRLFDCKYDVKLNKSPYKTYAVFYPNEYEYKLYKSYLEKEHQRKKTSKVDVKETTVDSLNAYHVTIHDTVRINLKLEVFYIFINDEVILKFEANYYNAAIIFEDPEKFIQARQIITQEILKDMKITVGFK